LSRAGRGGGRPAPGLIERHLPELRRGPVSDRALAGAALGHRERLDTARPDGLWHRPSGWRLGEPAPFRVRFAATDGGAVTVALTGPSTQARARIEREDQAVALSLAPHDRALTGDGLAPPAPHP